MKWTWKFGLTVACIVLLGGGAAALWFANIHRLAEKTLAASVNALRIRAEQGDAKSESDLAYMYSHGQGVSQDFGEAFRWRHKSADQGYAAGEIGLAYMYMHGQGTPQDKSEALRWYRKAAESGDAYAENSLGIMYQLGDGVSQDYPEALSWYRKAVDQNYPAAQCNLGYMYYYGRGVQRDVPEAYRWYRKAAAHGDENSQQFLGLRGRGISATYAITFSIEALGSLMLLAGPLFPKNNFWNRPSKSTSAAGIVGLCCTGLGLYAHSQVSVFPSELAASSFTFARHILTGLFLFMAISVLTSLTVPKRARVLLGILGVMFLSFNIWAITLAATNQVILNLPASARVFSTINGMILGMATPFVALSLRPKTTGAAEA